jgi:hypothetical protein
MTTRLENSVTLLFRAQKTLVEVNLGHIDFRSLRLLLLTLVVAYRIANVLLIH